MGSTDRRVYCNKNSDQEKKSFAEYIQVLRN